MHIHTHKHTYVYRDSQNDGHLVDYILFHSHTDENNLIIHIHI